VHLGGKEVRRERKKRMSYFTRYSQSFEPFENKWAVMNKVVISVFS
jgi:hypothetical protein